jgi:hypothetical protein
MVRVSVSHDTRHANDVNSGRRNSHYTLFGTTEEPKPKVSEHNVPPFNVDDAMTENVFKLDEEQKPMFRTHEDDSNV